MAAANEAVRSGQERTEADTGGQAFSRDYSEAIDLLDKGELKRGEDTHIQVLDHTPQIYIEKTGAENRRIVMAWDIAYLAMKRGGSIKGHYHNLGSDLMKQIPGALEHPVLIITKPGNRINAVLPMRKDGKTILISVEMDVYKQTIQEGKDDSDKFNIVVTAMDARDSYIRNLVENPENSVAYKNEELSFFIPQLNLSQKAAVSGDDLERPSGNDDTTGRGNVKGKLSRELDSRGEQLSPQQAEYFRNSKERSWRRQARMEGKLDDRVLWLFAQRENNVFSEQFGDVSIKKSSIRSEHRHGGTDGKVRSYPAIPDVIKNGVVIDSFEKHPGVERIVVAAPIIMGEQKYYMGVMLQRSIDSQRLYAHDVVIEKEPTGIFEDDLSTTGSPKRGELHITDILLNALNVKRKFSRDTDSERQQLC